MYKTEYFDEANDITNFLNKMRIPKDNIIHIENIGTYNWVLIYLER